MEENNNSLRETDSSGKENLNKRKIHLKRCLIKIGQGVTWITGITFFTIKGLFSHLFTPTGGISPIDDIREAFRHIPLRKKWFGYILMSFFITIYLLSGVYTVAPGEEAVAKLFGKVVREQIPEGLHYYLPWPFGSIEKVNMMEIRRVDMWISSKDESTLFPKEIPPTSTKREEDGHSMHGNSSSKIEKSPTENPVRSKNQFLTGDENILEIKMNIQYRIKDVRDYLFNTDRPESFISYSIRAALTEIFGKMHVDDLLTVAKSQIQKMIAHRAQNMLDEYKTGLYILNVNLQEVNPPKEAAEAFREVASAKEEREEKINKAQGYWNVAVPEARGKAQKIISEAEAYKEEVVNRASGDAQRFLSMLKEYKNTKEITKYRLYLETMEKVLNKANKFVVDSKKEKINLKFLK